MFKVFPLRSGAKDKVVTITAFLRKLLANYPVNAITRKINSRIRKE